MLQKYVVDTVVRRVCKGNSVRCVLVRVYISWWYGREAWAHPWSLYYSVLAPDANAGLKVAWAEQVSEVQEEACHQNYGQVRWCPCAMDHQSVFRVEYVKMKYSPISETVTLQRFGKPSYRLPSQFSVHCQNHVWYDIKLHHSGFISKELYALIMYAMAINYRNFRKDISLWYSRFMVYPLYASITFTLTLNCSNERNDIGSCQPLQYSASCIVRKYMKLQSSHKRYVWLEWP